MTQGRSRKASESFSAKDDVVQDSYRSNADHPVKILLSLYRGKYRSLFLSTFFYTVKHSAVWVLPIVTANIVNYVTEGQQDVWNGIFWNAAVILLLIVLNVPANYLHTRFKSSATRSVEAALRGALVRKIQRLSILCHKNLQSGRLQSKVMRDVEAVETLSSQIFISLLNIVINIAVALAVTVTKSRVVFLFFLLTIPVAALTIVFFKQPMRKRNQDFRKEMETTSARVLEMLEMVPITRAHALEEEETANMSLQLLTVAREGYPVSYTHLTLPTIYSV